MDALLDYDSSLTRPPWTDAGRAATLGMVSTAAKVILRVLNTFRVEGDGTERFRALALQREPGVGLLTYSNHTSTFDDPGITSALLPWWAFWAEPLHGKMRWTMCAQDVCFLNDLLRDFFASGKTLPVDRSGGVHQPVLGTAGRIVGAGGWLHVFPEGRVRPAGDVGPFRQGIGKVICDARAAAGGRDPLIVPVYHSGMGRVVPYFEASPRGGNSIDVVVGRPVDLSAVTCRCGAAGEDQAEVWRDIAAVLRESLMQLQARAPPNPNQLEERPGLAEEIEARAAEAAGVMVARGEELPGCSYSSPPQQQQQQQQQQYRASLNAAAGWRERGGFAAVTAPQFVYSSVLRPPPWAADQERRQRLWAEGRLLGPAATLWQHQQQQQQAGASLADGPLAAGRGSEAAAAAAAAEATGAQPVGWLGRLRRRQLLALWRRRAASAEQQQLDGALLRSNTAQGQSDGTQQQQQQQQQQRHWWRWRPQRAQREGDGPRSASVGDARGSSGVAAAAGAAAGWGRGLAGAT